MTTTLCFSFRFPGDLGRSGLQRLFSKLNPRSGLAGEGGATPGAKFRFLFHDFMPCGKNRVKGLQRDTNLGICKRSRCPRPKQSPWHVHVSGVWEGQGESTEGGAQGKAKGQAEGRAQGKGRSQKVAAGGHGIGWAAGQGALQTASGLCLDRRVEDATQRRRLPCTSPISLSRSWKGTKPCSPPRASCGPVRFYDIQGLLQHPKLLNAMCAGTRIDLHKLPEHSITPCFISLGEALPQDGRDKDLWLRGAAEADRNLGDLLLLAAAKV